MLISAPELKQALDQGEKKLILDCRHDLMDHSAGERAYVSGHIPGAYFINLDTQLSGEKDGHNGRHPLPSPQAFYALLLNLGLTDATALIAYDDNGGQFAARLWWLARWIGHAKVQVLDGGIRAWTACAGPLELGALPGAVTAASLSQEIRSISPHMPTVDARFVLENIATEKALVIDARAAARYRGEIEPIDPVAGHIPGAANRPTATNLQENGCFKSAGQLRQEFDQLLAGRQAQDIVHQCGSGVTACHNLLAMEIAGLSGAKLYPGSWSEWVSDPSRPVDPQHP